MPLPESYVRLCQRLLLCHMRRLSFRYQTLCRLPGLVNDKVETKRRAAYGSFKVRLCFRRPTSVIQSFLGRSHSILRKSCHTAFILEVLARRANRT